MTTNNRAHATLSASGAERWINCPGSVKMAAHFPSQSSAAAEEGTLAHELAAFKIEHREEIDQKNDDAAAVSFTAGIGQIKKEVDGFYQEHPELDDDFAYMNKTLEPYIDYVAREYQEALKADEAAVLMTEQRVDFSDIVPEGFGTSDVIIIGGGRVTVIDLKYGKGVAVSAKDNPQIRLYALGAINLFDMIYDFDRVKMVIYQPRRDSVTEEEMPVDDLKAWAEAVVKPAAEKALSDNPPYHPGDWCDSHFCPGAGVCKARANFCLGLERHSGKDPALLTDEEISDALQRAEALRSFAKKLNDYALGEIQTGHPIPGWKVVEGKTIRAYTDLDKVAEAAIAAGYPEALIYQRSLIGITGMEKLMGKKKFQEVLGKLVEKPQGAPKLAPESDERPAFNSAKADFDD